ncbi:MAG TPA: hypothetical protein DEF02_03515 [Clostridiales bacterium]|nr:hypothetical protein [Clostridiales bacterium]HBP52129.1 hypothetical protein [Clostridiales bacterium]HBW05635.1 hypothetical protein [Clostridiales bacterium]HCH92976.1 hypothetical protein [Clostridiales bacterium]
MDYLLPDDETVKKMCAEYACYLNKKTGALGYINELNSNDNQSDDIDSRLKESQNQSGLSNDPSGDSQRNLQRDSQNDEAGKPNRAQYAYTCDIKVLFLYIILLLGYNARYGTQIYDADRGVGRVRSARCAFGSLNNLVSNNG